MVLSLEGNIKDQINKSTSNGLQPLAIKQYSSYDMVFEILEQ